jgi:hypothetical protein
MAQLKMRAGVLGSLEDELEVALEAGFLPVDWRITILRSSERWLTLTIEMQNRMATRLFPSKSADAIVGFLQHVGRELGSNP